MPTSFLSIEIEHEIGFEASIVRTQCCRSFQAYIHKSIGTELSLKSVVAVSVDKLNKVTLFKLLNTKYCSCRV